MSQPSPAEIERLTHVQTELREAFSARGHNVDVALGADPAFGSGYSVAHLRRDLALNVIDAGARMVGMTLRPLQGGARELVAFDTEINVERRYRCLKGVTRVDGSMQIFVNSDSTLTDSEQDPGIIPSEQWVFCWSFDIDGMIETVIVAEILGYETGKPGGLILGSVITLGGTTPPSVGFVPSDDDDLFGDEQEGEEQTGTDGLGG